MTHHDKYPSPGRQRARQPEQVGAIEALLHDRANHHKHDDDHDTVSDTVSDESVRVDA